MIMKISKQHGEGVWLACLTVEIFGFKCQLNIHLCVSISICVGFFSLILWLPVTITKKNPKQVSQGAARRSSG